MFRTYIVVIILVCQLGVGGHVFAQDAPPQVWLTPGWIWYQAIPGMSWTVHDAGTNYALEWEVMPVMYSFGLTKLASPWKVLSSEPPARFTGSIELLVGLQLYTSKLHRSHWGFSGAVLGHIPVIERGEYLTLNLGAERRWIGGEPNNFAVGGISFLFGFLEYNLHYAPKKDIWVHQLGMRFF